MDAQTQAANALLQKHLLGACVESFGLYHQILCVQFRDDMDEDHLLSVDTKVSCEPSGTKYPDLLPDEPALLLFSGVNLKRVINIQCTEISTLTIEFDNGRSLIFNGSPADETISEPWQVGKGNFLESDYYLVIATHGGGYSLWNSEAEAPN